MTSSSLSVIKVGGSLFDLPDLPTRLRALLAGVASDRIFIPGGGKTADLVRDWDENFQLGEETAHWLALRAMSLNAHFLAAILPHGQVVPHPEERHAVLRTAGVPILDVYAWATLDEQAPEHLPHCWEVTSDSVAARVALTADASDLILLKSVEWQDQGDWHQGDWHRAAAAGIVDRHFPRLCCLADRLRIRAINLRKKPAPGEL